MGRPFLVWAFVVAMFLVVASPAVAHRGGKAEPRIAAGVSEEGGLVRMLTVRVTDFDGGDPIAGATVVALGEVAVPSDLEGRTSRVRLPEGRPGLYRAQIRFPEAGAWRIRITVSGEKVVTARATLPVAVEAERDATADAPTSTTGEAHGGAGTGGVHGGDVTPLATTVEDDLVQGDYLRMAMLWIHGLAAMGWIIGVLVMVAALSTRPGVLAETARTRLAGAYQSWGAPVHWGLVPVIVGTGVYNMLYVTPFDLPWSPAMWSELAAVPYGYLYEGILLTKLGLFAVLLVTGTMTFLRTVRLELPVAPVSNPHPNALRIMTSVLGPAGIFYLATIPLILAAAMALRYVHVLNHVAMVTSHG